jgi:hypothetical protein
MKAGDTVELVMMGASAALVSGVVVSEDSDEVVVDGIPEVSDGTAVCVRAISDEPWVYGRSTSWVDKKLTIEVRGSSAPDRREFSRVYGALKVRYLVHKGEGAELASRRWLTNGDALSDTWHEPDPFMDFSGSGLKFHHNDVSAPGDLLLLELYPPGAKQVHRATALVVRVDPIPEDEKDEEPFSDGAEIPTHCVAVHFDYVGPAAIDDLVRFAERIQEALL